MDPHDMNNDGSLHNAQYYQYQQEEGVSYLYAPQMAPQTYLQNVPAAPPPRSLSTSDLQQAMHLRTLDLDLPQHHQHPHSQNPLPHSPHYAHPYYTAQQGPISPQDDGSIPTPIEATTPGSPPPVSPNPYDRLSPPVSGSDTSEHGHGGVVAFNPGTLTPNTTPSSGAASPTSSRGSSLVHRTHHTQRYNPTPSPTRRRRARSQEYSDGEEENGISRAVSSVPDPHFMEHMANTRKEVTRKQRIEAEQRRRDELREGYARLKDVLPITNQKSSKVSLLERATTHIINLSKMNETLQARITQQDLEIARLRHLNERISGVVTGPSDLSLLHPSGSDEPADDVKVNPSTFNTKLEASTPTSSELNTVPKEHLIAANQAAQSAQSRALSEGLGY